MARQPSRRPEKVFRIGFVSASVFGNPVETQGGSRTLRSVTVRKRYLDGQDVKYTGSLDSAELPQAIRVLQLAQQYIESLEADVSLD